VKYPPNASNGTPMAMPGCFIYRLTYLRISNTNEKHHPSQEFAQLRWLVHQTMRGATHLIARYL